MCLLCRWVAWVPFHTGGRHCLGRLPCKQQDHEGNKGLHKTLGIVSINAGLHVLSKQSGPLQGILQHILVYANILQYVVTGAALVLPPFTLERHHANMSPSLAVRSKSFQSTVQFQAGFCLASQCLVGRGRMGTHQKPIGRSDTHVGLNGRAPLP